jgi:type VI protein secretion system component VasA
MKSQAPSSKLQRSSKSQAPNLRRAQRAWRVLGILSLVFLWSLELGFWRFSP